MKVHVKISEEYTDPYAVIYTNQMTDDIQRLIKTIEADKKHLLVDDKNKISIIKIEDIYMVRVENGETVIYGEDKCYYSRERLYAVKEKLGSQFMQISKSTLINLTRMDNIEAGFNGTLVLKLQNGCKDYVTRTYLKDFKSYLGL